MKQWFVVHTQPLKEMIALHHLTVQGFEAYLPRYKKIRRHARKKESILAPLFPRYLFVELDTEKDRWRSVNGTRGVAYLLTFDERPASVSDEIIAALKTREDEAGCVPVESLSMFVKGDKVRILEGAFEGYTAVFEKLDDKTRVQVLLNFLGRETKIQIPVLAVEAA